MNTFGKDVQMKSVRIWSYSAPYFPAFGLNAERYEVSLRIHSECRKIRTRITPNTDTFHAVIVLIYNDKTPKSQWKIGKILELIESVDGRIRGAIVLTKTNGTEHLIKRPLNRLYLLECDKKGKDVKIRFVDDANVRMMQEADT